MSKRRTRRSTEKSKTTSKATSDVFSLLADITDKLHLLNYEDTFCKESDFGPLDPGFFAINLQDQNSGVQFPYFSAIVLWLLKCFGHRFNPWNDLDGPNAIANNIVNECKQLGFKADFPPTKLRQGFGEEVCQILDFLTTLNLERIAFKLQDPIYHPEESKTNAQVGDADGKSDEDTHDDDGQTNGSDADGDEDDNHSQVSEDVVSSENDSDSENNFGGGNGTFGNDWGGVSSGLSSKKQGGSLNRDEFEEKSTLDVLETRVTRAEWKLELERVLPRLEVRPDSTGHEYRTHLMKTKSHMKTLSDVWPDASGKLGKMKEELDAALNKIASRERQLQREFSELALTYTEKHNALLGLNETHDELNSSVAELTNKVQNVNEKIENVKLQMEHHNNSITDTTPLRRIRETMAQMKQELVQMELRIGVARHSLLHASLKAQEESKLRRR